jgi:hypothetical protein
MFETLRKVWRLYHIDTSLENIYEISKDIPVPTHIFHFVIGDQDYYTLSKLHLIPKPKTPKKKPLSSHWI